MVHQMDLVQGKGSGVGPGLDQEVPQMEVLTSQVFQQTEVHLLRESQTVLALVHCTEVHQSWALGETGDHFEGVQAQGLMSLKVLAMPCTGVCQSQAVVQNKEEPLQGSLHLLGAPGRVKVPGILKGAQRSSAQN